MSIRYISRNKKWTHYKREGVNLCKKFDGEFPKRYAQDCFNFMGYTYKANEIIDRFEPSHLWEKEKNKWKRKQEIF